LSRQQRTLGSPVSLRGFGYWTGQDVTVEFRPAAPNTGIVFLRSDQQGAPPIPALVRHCIEVPRRTVLARGAARVEMIEHVMAALAGLSIDNCEVWVSGPELPGFDGSSLPYVQALQAGSVRPQLVHRAVLAVDRTIRVGDREGWVEARPCSHLRLEYHLDYGAGSPIGTQSICLDVAPETFVTQLAAARTFLTKQEADALLAKGLGQHVTFRDLLVYGPQGPIDNELRFADECVRHKALDLLGDLALAGIPLQAHVIACRSGHRQNAELVRAVLAQAALAVPRRRSA
jgi:UDP-3-O-acyl N-acetylglucosamine deacetylase